MSKPNTDSWGGESAALEAEILALLHTSHPAVRPPKSEQKIPSVVIPEPAPPIRDMTVAERAETPFWKNWEAHINDPERNRESIPARRGARRKF